MSRPSSQEGAKRSLELDTSEHIKKQKGCEERESLKTLFSANESALREHLIELSLDDLNVLIPLLDTSEILYLKGCISGTHLGPIINRFAGVLHSLARRWFIGMAQSRFSEIMRYSAFPITVSSVADMIGKITQNIWCSIFHNCIHKPESFNKIAHVIFKFARLHHSNLELSFCARFFIGLVQHVIESDDAVNAEKYGKAMTIFSEQLLSDIDEILLESDSTQTNSIVHHIASIKDCQSFDGIIGRSQRQLFLLTLKSIENLKIYNQSSKINSAKFFLLPCTVVSEEKAQQFLNSRQSVSSENLVSHLAEFLTAIQHILWDSNAIDSFKILSPLRNKGEQLKLVRIDYPVEFGLRGDRVKGVNVKDLYVYCSEKVIANENLIEKLRSEDQTEETVFEISGSPGTGKSITMARFAQKRAGNGEKLLWISSDQDKSIFKVVFAFPNIVLATEVSVKYITALVNKENLCELTVIDGMTDSDLNLASSAYSWARRTKRPAFIVRSEGLQGLKGTYSIKTFKWELEDYHQAMAERVFRESVSDILTSDSDLVSSIEFKQIGVLTEPESCKKATETIINEKFAFAGGSARFMFAKKTKDVKMIINENIDKLTAYSSLSESNPGANRTINTLFATGPDSTLDFVSEYAANMFKEKNRGLSFTSFWKVAKKLNNSGRGTIFQHVFEEAICNHYEDISVTRFMQGSQVAETWSIGSCER